MSKPYWFDLKRTPGEYDYSELRAAAFAPNATKDDILTLYRWFELYGDMFWNGEYYDADNGIRLYPVYEENSDDFDVVDVEIR
jgi:hypothetical protein